MKLYNLQEQIISIDTFTNLIKRNILPLGIDISDTPNNIEPNILEILNTYYEYQDGSNIMTLNLAKLEDDYTNKLIKLKRYIRVNPNTGDIIVYKISTGIITVRCLASYVSIYIKPFFSSSKELEHINLQTKTKDILGKYLIKEKSRDS